MFEKKSSVVHSIYGYFQIEEKKERGFYDWMDYHPHVCANFRLKKDSNTVYISRDKLSWNNDISGAGLFKFSNDLVLTKGKCTKSKWNLDPNIFKGLKISYNTRDDDVLKPWKDGYFQSAGRGQEFVIEENSKVEKWAINLIGNHYIR